MKFSTAIMIIAVSFTITACGSSFEWFPSTTPPTILATIDGNAIFNNTTTHVAAFPVQVVFTANEAATVYFTTNGSDPTKASPFVLVSPPAGTNGPEISADTTLKFVGVDTSDNASAIQTTTIVSP